MAMSAFDKGFIDACAQQNVRNPRAVKGLMKIAYHSFQDQLLKKEAMDPSTERLIIGAILGGGLGAELGGAAYGLKGALIGGFGGAGLGTLGGVGYNHLVDRIKGDVFKEYVVPYELDRRKRHRKHGPPKKYLV